MTPHDEDKDNPGELIRSKNVTAFGLWSLSSFDELRSEPAVAAPQMPAVAKPVPAPSAMGEVELEAVRLSTLEEIEVIHQDAYNEGFTTGECDDLHVGQLKVRQEAEEALKGRLQSLERLMTQLLEPIAEQDALIEQGTVNLVNHAARQVIQRKPYMDSSHVRQVLREALRLLPMGAANVRVRVNPQDFEWVKALHERHEESQWIFESDLLLPGGCHIETEHSHIDATTEMHLAQVVKQPFEQQREQATHPLASGIRVDLDVPGDVDAP